MQLSLPTDDISPLLGPDHERYARAASEFVNAQLGDEHPHSDERAREQAPEIIAAVGRSGLLGALEPLDLRKLCLLREAVAWKSPLADALVALQGLGSMPILLAGDAQQREWLPKVQSGQAIAAFAMTEQEAGSDVANMACRATIKGDHYDLRGEKCYISNAGIASFYCVFAKTSDDPGHRNIECLLVPADTPGLRFVKAQVLSSPHPLGVIAFEGCTLPRSARIGEAGRGFALGMATLDRLRPSVASAALGMARRALDESLQRVQSRKQFGKSLSEFQMVQAKLAQMHTELQAARLLTYRAAWRLDQGAERITHDAALAKMYATEAAQRIIDQAVQLHGGAGCLAGSVVDLLYRSVRALRIYEGTTEIQQLVIARHLLASSPAPSS